MEVTDEAREVDKRPPEGRLVLQDLGEKQRGPRTWNWGEPPEEGAARGGLSHARGWREVRAAMFPFWPLNTGVRACLWAPSSVSPLDPCPRLCVVAGFSLDPHQVACPSHGAHPAQAFLHSDHHRRHGCYSFAHMTEVSLAFSGGEVPGE